MKPCSDDGRCRFSYLCALPSEITEDGERACETVPEDERVARVIDLDDLKSIGKICAALVQMDCTDGGVESDNVAQ